MSRTAALEDFRQIVKEVLENSQPTLAGTHHYVNSTLLKILQAEYNIHFVEPEDEQIDIL
tara:strand:- start:1155 stop:1334 length:180 start_codon:yes stop_codon:yes gene_type:complete